MFTSTLGWVGWHAQIGCRIAQAPRSLQSWRTDRALLRRVGALMWHKLHADIADLKLFFRACLIILAMARLCSGQRRAALVASAAASGGGLVLPSEPRLPALAAE